MKTINEVRKELENRKDRNGERRPNSQEEWLDTQARALFQAANRIIRATRF